MGTPKVKSKNKIQIIEDALRKQYRVDQFKVYEYNPVSIRVRIEDESFKGLSLPQREQKVHPVLASLPPDVQADISMLLLVAPGEPGNPLLSYEFDHPSPNRM